MLTRAVTRMTRRRADAGASSVEYGLIVFAIAATMVVALFALGQPVFGLFDTSCQTIKTGVTQAASPQAC